MSKESPPADFGSIRIPGVVCDALALAAKLTDPLGATRQVLSEGAKVIMVEGKETLGVPFVLTPGQKT